ncbi:hypothetical protein KV557_24650 [Kitasatospora aureofaciens]|uniref:hypothetical protein n=1 Tax=Kitasatospora aureofaciens TaxID=1894 RepID=UPI001C45961E|nr:hypothetical protein [Kitasatospora aureofaciens]MBV6700255.1 hypothetical protein [Kitasatospora aureofaciens]
MPDSLETHLGYQRLDHKQDCKKPSFEIDLRQSKGYRDYPASGHVCTAGQHDEDGYDCDHANTYSKTTIRIICQSCEQAYELRGEDVTLSSRSPQDLAVDLHPKRTAGLYLYEGPRRNIYNGQPEWILVAHNEAGGRWPVAEEHVAGIIFPKSGKRGGLKWTANAGMQINPTKPRGDFFRHTWERYADTEFPTPAAAAKWIGAVGAELYAQRIAAQKENEK